MRYSLTVLSTSVLVFLGSACSRQQLTACDPSASSCEAAVPPPAQLQQNPPAAGHCTLVANPSVVQTPGTPVQLTVSDPAAPQGSAAIINGIPGQSLQITPQTTGQYNASFGSDTCSIQVTVSGTALPPPASCAISLSQTSITAGGNANLIVTTLGQVGSALLNGTQDVTQLVLAGQPISVSPPNTSNAPIQVPFTLQVNGPGNVNGPGQCGPVALTVNPVPPPPPPPQLTATLTANPSTVTFNTDVHGNPVGSTAFHLTVQANLPGATYGTPSASPGVITCDQNLSCTLNAAGTFTITVNVTASGQTVAATTTVTVSDPCQGLAGGLANQTCCVSDNSYCSGGHWGFIASQNGVCTLQSDLCNPNNPIQINPAGGSAAVTCNSFPAGTASQSVTVSRGNYHSTGWNNAGNFQGYCQWNWP